MLLTKVYYNFKFLIPRPLQIRLRRYLVRRKLAMYADIWPIDPNAAKPLGIRGHDPNWGKSGDMTQFRQKLGSCPQIFTDLPQIAETGITSPDSQGWSDWPDGKKFALVLTHDIETVDGLEKCMQLAEMEEHLGFRSSFNFVAGDYPVPAALCQHLTDHGFEIGVHGLHHSGNPFRSKSVFLKQSAEINRALKEWGAVGFRSPSMYHNLEMLHHLDIEYDASTFDTDPFEPQPDGMSTIFPFWVPDQDRQKGYVELPYTLPQDFLLFVLLQEKNIDIWKRKLDWIAE